VRRPEPPKRRAGRAYLGFDDTFVSASFAGFGNLLINLKKLNLKQLLQAQLRGRI
jgi:hypothetical protein